MSLLHRTLWLVVFAIAMGFLEAAVVVYLRELYYPNGFAFPLVVLGQKIGLVEILRESATVVMLLAVGTLAGRNALQRLAFFLIAFAVWDIFYYVFLKLALDWPASLLTWDILFLIPAPWVGPVLSPLIICATMLMLAAVLLRNEQRGFSTHLNLLQWSLILGGSLVVVIAWMWDYLSLSGGIDGSPARALEVLSTHVPLHFNWGLFAAGEIIIAAGIVHYSRGNKSTSASAPAAESSPDTPGSASH